MAGRAVVAALIALGLWAGPASAARIDVLVFTKTAGFRHASIPAGLAAIRALGARHGFRVRATDDASVFTSRRLRPVEAVVFLNTTGTVLDRAQRRALRRYVRGGGGFVGVHSAADTEHEWPFYGRLVGARFRSHPIPQAATFVNEAPGQPATAHLAQRFAAFDELYSFEAGPRARVRVLLAVDESTYAASDPMGDHPMSWCHDLGRGRAFYTALGHESALYAQPWFRRHLLGGIRTAARAARADCAPRQAPTGR